jgi:hypothetical protein
LEEVRKTPFDLIVLTIICRSRLQCRNCWRACGRSGAVTPRSR